ncbi:MAG TPA: helix-turn-helix domain-containing protein [Nanoarchaeota archaeon]|nr:helix-turn-helix domain-containing protein [Nanoarchaeota archaeon]
MREIKEAVKNLLIERDYEVYESTGCFDIAGKKDELLLIKILKNIDSFVLQHALSLQSISSALDAYPFLIGNNTNYEKLVPGVIYERFQIPAMCIETFRMILDKEFPEFYRQKGGVYVEIDPVALRKARIENKLSQKQLANLVGVSSKTIYMHEKFRLKASIKIVKKIEKVLGKKVSGKAHVFRKYEFKGKAKDSLEKFVAKKLNEIGFETYFTYHAPFDVSAKEKEIIISDIEQDKRKISYRYKKFAEFVEFLGLSGAVITEDYRKECKIPIISKKDLEEVKTKKDFIKLLRN